MTRFSSKTAPSTSPSTVSRNASSSRAPGVSPKTTAARDSINSPAPAGNSSSRAKHTGRPTSRRCSRSCVPPIHNRPDMREIRIPGIRRVLRISWSPSAVGRDVDDEIRFHLDARVTELMQQGRSELEARDIANAEYGDVDESRRELALVDGRRVDNERKEELLMSVGDDLRYAARSLLRHPALLLV